jgi:small neutral amino acid transporter SnatA (MarC family)
MPDITFASAVAVLLLVTDPIGNIPLFSTLLKRVRPERRTPVVLRGIEIFIRQQ